MPEEFKKERYFEGHSLELIEKTLGMKIPDRAFKNDDFARLLNEYLTELKNYKDIIASKTKKENMETEKRIVDLVEKSKEVLKKIPNSRPELN